MALSEYRRKRELTRTPEPRGRAKPTGGPRIFVVQKHASRHTHYDLRLRLRDVLKSWAVPKGPSLDPREKRLAVEVEDHPVEYAEFEGVIPEGQYGAGTVMVWDRGSWSAEGDAATSLRDGMLKFRLEGERLKGRWMLVRTRTEEGPPHWLLVKERDADADPAVNAETYATSVISGRTMSEIASGEPPRKRETGRAKEARACDVRGARAAAMPAKLSPQLALAVDSAPEGDEWLHEVKFDGYRLLVFKKTADVRIVSRGGLDWTGKLADLASAVQERITCDAVLDGEAVILDTAGVSNFQALQNAIHNRRSKSIVFMAFDLPWCDGFDLTRSPIEQRRGLLARLIGARQEGRLRFSEHIEGNGTAALESARLHGLEGIVSKKKGSAYSQARTPAWVKVKCFNQQEFVIAGFTRPEGSREEFGALLLGVHDVEGALRFAGKVGTGFDVESLRHIGGLLRSRVQPRPAFVDPPTGAEAKGVTWTRPDVVGQVRFRDWSDGGVIRHPSFRGLREDRDPRTIVREPERAVMQSEKPTAHVDERTPRTERRARAAPAIVESPGRLRLTHPERIVFPDRGAGYSVTKRQLAEYYEAVGARMLPQIENRPLAIVRCPGGEGAKCFFQKHPARGMPVEVSSVEVRGESGTTEKHLLVGSVAGLLGLVQMNAIEIHPWGSTAADLEHPDRLVFDLDPGDDVPFREVVLGANTVREALSQVKLRAFVRTTGGRGLHVVVPIRRVHSWDRALAFARAAAESLVKVSPRRFIASAAKARRSGRIYVDYLRNTRGATAIASYSVRARPGAPVALPIGWDELAGLSSGATFNVVSALRRLASGAPDPWADFAGSAGVLAGVDSL